MPRATSKSCSTAAHSCCDAPAPSPVPAPPRTRRSLTAGGVADYAPLPGLDPSFSVVPALSEFTAWPISDCVTIRPARDQDDGPRPCYWA